MFKFQVEQQVYEIGGVRFGGQPGKRRTVMVGSLFYPRHSAVEDRSAGRLKTGACEKAVHGVERAADETGCPAALMIYAETERAMASYLEQVAELSSLPLFVDAPLPEVRLAGLSRAREMGLGNRVVYNTLSAGTTEAELNGVAQGGVESAVLLAFNPKDLSTKGKIYLLENGGGLLDSGLIELATRHGVKKPLIDTAVMAAEQNAGSALRAIFIAKAKWGYPAGCALNNAVESWPLLRKLEGDDRKLFRYVDVASVTMPIMAGADYVVYGPVEYSRRAFHVAAFADEMMRGAAADI
jgi:tetrahydromethanopterin S-methyltransferase subunit H